jgi:hypothetical protein
MCPTNAEGQFVAAELAEEQTLDKLYAFGERLAVAHDERVRGTEHCQCR